MVMRVLTRAGSRLLRLESNSISRRGLSADHHGPKKVNMWEAPGNPGNWKEEQFVFASLAGWGAIFYGGYRAATGGSKKPKGSAGPAPPAVVPGNPKHESKPSVQPAPAKKLERKSEPKAAVKPPAKSEPVRKLLPKKTEASKKPSPSKKDKEEQQSKKYPS